MSVKRCWPSSPPDSITRSPAPTIRSNTDWLKCTVFTRSSGISTPCLATTPCLKINRSDVITKLVVAHFMYLPINHRMVSTRKIRDSQPMMLRSRVPESVTTSVRIPNPIEATSTATGLA